MRSDPPVVSVALPTHDRAGLLPRAVGSVLGQTFRSLELIVVDDASADRTPEVVAGFDDPRVRSFRHAENRGGAAARNTAIRAARGDYVAFLDSDDEWLPRKLELQVERMRRAEPGVGVLYARNATCDARRRLFRRQALELLHGDVYEELLSGWCPSITSSVLVRWPALEAVGGFDESLPSFHDYDLWIRLARDHRFVGMDRTLTLLHEHEAPQLSRDPGARRRALEAFLEKWAPEMEAVAGPEAVRALRRRHLGSILWQATMGRLRRGDRSGAWRLFLSYLREGTLPPSWLHCVEFAAGQLGGERLHAVLTTAWRRMTWSPCPPGEAAAVPGGNDPEAS